MATIKYTVDSKHRVNFDCPVCQYENCTAAYRDAPCLNRSGPSLRPG